MDNFVSTFDYKLIYVFRINDNLHSNMLKVGEATLHTDKSYDTFAPNCHELNYAARKRIDSYTSTAGIKYELLYTEIAVFNEIQDDGSIKKKSFNDHKVHEVLKRSGIKNHYFNTNKSQNEWFVTDLATVKNAITAVKNNKKALDGASISYANNPIVFRPEQEDAINKTIKQFKVSNHMLWNAKMRFGKTLSTLEVVKRMKFNKTIIITHRPAVDDGWYEDFKKIFYESDTEYNYGSKNNGMTIENLIASNKPFVYFASIQDLRGSIEVGGKYDKNDEVFEIKWDFVVTDEAHEGTQTELGKKVRDKLINDKNKELSLSGTPFNLFDQYSNDDTYTWDYIMEQQAKYDWISNPIHFGDHNPYEELPKLNMYTYHLEELLTGFTNLDDKAFNFKEFFRTWTGDEKKDLAKLPAGANIDDFVHEDAVNAFLDLLCKKDHDTNYPFSTTEFRDFFRHTLWMVPGVKEAKALSAMLKKHAVFGSGLFNIVNVAGSGDDDFIAEQKAMDKLRKAIGKNPEDSYTITLSCGRLTTGVTVPEWTAVLMLSGTYTTDAKQYLQTIFRVQSPANINGKIKENCYVFDFAPDRTLRVVYDAVKKMSVKRIPKVDISVLMGEFLNFCPVISLDVSKMIEFKAEQLLQEIKRVYTERVVDSGFEDPKLYNDELLKLDDLELEKFEKLQKIIGKTKQTKKPGDVQVTENNLTDEQRALLEELKKKKTKKPLTEEEKKQLEELNKIKEQKNTAISILRGISIRIPLLVYGLDKDYDYDITIDEFANMVDDSSWEEFMPLGVTKDIFKDFIKYYDKDIFVSCCRKIRATCKRCDDLEPTERIKELAILFSKFKNPDKETVLTPWRVVNMHLSEALGGYNFYDDNYSKILDQPRFVDKHSITNSVFNASSKILEINSKTGLYPLYMAYSLYRQKLLLIDNAELSFNEKTHIWDEVVKEQIYVICKTPMAKQITERTLLGYRTGKTNMHAFDDLIMQLKEKPDKFIEKVNKKSFWKIGGNEEMKFDAVVGNPPYQENLENRSEQPPVYHLFYDAAFKLSKRVSLISPARFLFNAGKTPKIWNEKILNDNHFKVVKYEENSQAIFPSVDIKGGIAITYRDESIDFGKIGIFVKNDFMGDIVHKVKNQTISFMKDIVYSNTSYKYTSILAIDFPQFFKKDANGKSRLSGGSARYLASSAFEKLPELFCESVAVNDNTFIKIIGRKDNHRKEMFINKKYVCPPNNFDKYKVFISSSNGSGEFGETLTPPFVCEPFVGATETFLSIGSFNTKIEAENLVKYIKTKFARALLGTLKVTQGNKNSDVWANIPIQNFAIDSDINWDNTINEIDKQMYKKYLLTEEEINFIETHVKPM